MKRILIYIAILLAVVLVPLERTDVGELRPVQTVAVYRDGKAYVIATDTGDQGEGKTVPDALTDLKQKTPAVIYLDTAQFLLTGKDADDAVEELRQHFRSSVELYSFRGDADLEAVSKYLTVHGNGPKLKRWHPGGKLPVLVCAGEQIKLVENTK